MGYFSRRLKWNQRGGDAPNISRAKRRREPAQVAEAVSPLTQQNLGDAPRGKKLWTGSLVRRACRGRFDARSFCAENCFTRCAGACTRLLSHLRFVGPQPPNNGIAAFSAHARDVDSSEKE